MSSNRYPIACEAIDRAHADDPAGEAAAYAVRMVEWVRKLSPQPSEELLLSARAQHIRRWTLPRTQYPAGRAGYLQWRERLKRYHAEELAGIMREAGYEEASVAKASALVTRKNLAEDAEGQTLEDAACLVFLEFELSAFARKTPAEKVLEILRKTWTKMSSAAHAKALELNLDETSRVLVRRALS